MSMENANSLTEANSGYFFLTEPNSSISKMHSNVKESYKIQQLTTKFFMKSHLPRDDGMPKHEQKKAMCHRTFYKIL